MSLNAEAIYPADEPEFISFPSRRSVVHSTKGIVSSTQPLASQAGIRILQQGGNAADAAVAVAAALNMTEPGSTGVGGDMFCLFYDAKKGRVRALNGSGRTASSISLEMVRKDLGLAESQSGRLPMDSVHSVTVPGAAAGWVDCVEQFGNGHLTLKQILEPAIQLGEGFPVSELSATFWGASERQLLRASPNGHEMLRADSSAPGGYRAPRAGEIFSNPNLANTFRRLAKDNKAGFYEGPIAQALIKAVSELGGRLTADDLREHGRRGSEATDPICTEFCGQGVGERHQNRPVQLWEHAPNGQGIVALMAIGMLEELEKADRIRRFTRQDHNGVEYLHTVIEVLRMAFADASWYVADPAITAVPVPELLSRSYLAARAQEGFDPERASASPEPGKTGPMAEVQQQRSDTVYFAVTDEDGNGCSFINSNYGGFGSAIVPAGCGFTLHNRGAGFNLQPTDHPNVLAPSKRPYHTIIPAMLTTMAVSELRSKPQIAPTAEAKTDPLKPPHPAEISDRSQGRLELHSVFGVMGGYMQPQGHVQVMLNMLVFGLTPQAALDAPRFCIGAGMPNQGRVLSDTVYLEEGISEVVARQLQEMGHPVRFVRGYERGLFGRGQLIRVHRDEGRLVYSAGSDPRGDGAALAL